MSNALFPVLPGLAWSVGKQPEFSTLVSRAANGAETRIALWATPLWHFKLSFEILRDDVTDEMRTLAGFFLARRGRFDSFLFEDPDDCRAVDQALGAGDGTQTSFAALRTLGGFVEPVGAVNASRPVAVRLAGETADPAGWSIGDDGRSILFASPPAAGQMVHADFDFLFRVRFDMDTAEFEEFMHRLWRLQTCDLVSVK